MRGLNGNGKKYNEDDIKHFLKKHTVKNIRLGRNLPMVQGGFGETVLNPTSKLAVRRISERGGT